MAVQARSIGAARVSAARRVERIPIPAAFWDIATPLVVTRLVFLLLTIKALWWATFFRLPPEALSGHDGWFLDHWNQWDVRWYLRVAVDGYRLTPYEKSHVNLAFFPLYPALVHLWLQVWPWSRVAAAMLVSNICCVLATVYLYRLTHLEFGRDVAKRVMWLLAIFPTSLFLFAGYSESLFLLCLVACFYNLRFKHWLWAGFWGALATVTRPLGIITVIPFLIFWLEAHPLALRTPISLPWLRLHLRALLGLCLVPAGLLSYMVYLWLHFGNPLVFSASQQSWQRAWVWPWQTLIAAIIRPLAHFPIFTLDDMHGVIDTAVGFGFLVVTILATRTLPRAYVAMLWLFWLVVLSTPAILGNAASPLLSVPRFVLTAFPFFFFLAGNERRFYIACALSIPWFLLDTALFVNGGWIA
jgi:Gpi18-like mannosyltransferase